MNLLNLEKVKTVTVQGGRYEFKIRFISPLDRVNITQRRVGLQDGKPLECFSENEFLFFENVAVVDTCLEDVPKDFNKNESCLRWQDIDIINELANEIKKFTSEVDEKLKKNRPVK